MKKNRKIYEFILLTTVCLGTLFSSCDLFGKDDYYEEDEYGIKTHYERRTDDELIEEGYKYLTENFPNGSFGKGKIVRNEEKLKHIEYYSYELKQPVLVKYLWTYSTSYTVADRIEDEEEIHFYFWEAETNFFAKKYHPWEHSYREILGDWFAEYAVFFDYTDCSYPVFSSYEPEHFEEYMADNYYSVWNGATVSIAVKTDEYVAEWNDSFMFYFNNFLFSSKYCVEDEHCIKLAGKIFYLKDDVDVNSISAENLEDEMFVKENCSNVYMFEYAGDDYEEILLK